MDQDNILRLMELCGDALTGRRLTIQDLCVQEGAELSKELLALLDALPEEKLDGVLSLLNTGGRTLTVVSYDSLNGGNKIVAHKGSDEEEADLKEVERLIDAAKGLLDKESELRHIKGLHLKCLALKAELIGVRADEADRDVREILIADGRHGKVEDCRKLFGALEETSVGGYKDYRFYPRPKGRVYVVGALGGDMRVLLRHTSDFADRNDVLTNEVRAAQMAEAKAHEETRVAHEEIKILCDKLRKIANTDGMTGMLNRRAGIERLNAKIEEFKENGRNGRKLVLFLLDIDKFKAINDRISHECGDEAIRHFSKCLLDCSRAESRNQSTGELGESEIVVRLGGDEFFVAIEVDAAEDSLAIGNRIRKHVASTPFVWNKRDVFFTTSAGVCEYKVGDSVDDMLREADEALYQNKRRPGGRNGAAIRADDCGDDGQERFWVWGGDSGEPVLEDYIPPTTHEKDHRIRCAKRFEGASLVVRQALNLLALTRWGLLRGFAKLLSSTSKVTPPAASSGGALVSLATCEDVFARCRRPSPSGSSSALQTSRDSVNSGP